MWSDNETKRDLINFRHVADIAAERIAGAQGEPLSIGISGSWGVGKSSMMKLLKTSLEKREGADIRFVEFNAWLYQGYDDTRAALMEAMTRSLLDHATKDPSKFGKVVEKLKGVLHRVDKLRALSVIGGAALSWYTHDTTPAFIAGGLTTFRGMTDGDISRADVEGAQHLISDATKGGKELLKDKEKDEEGKSGGQSDATPQKAIQAFRDELESSLEEMNVTLVVLIDDLDRCLPGTAIATLEAMRLFLFLKRTAFVIAADDTMIRQSVRVHFKNPNLDDDLVTNYFDKLIQLPIRVPPLGTQDVRAYLMMLFVDASTLDTGRKEEIRVAICERLSQTWSGARVDKAFVIDAFPDCSPELQSRLALAERIAPILTTSTKIAGNPRLIKRFLNTLSLRTSMAVLQKVPVVEEVLVKLMLFERCGDKELYAEILRSVNESDDGHPVVLKDKEDSARGVNGASVLPNAWDDAFTTAWLALDPPLANLDLRGATYVSRENHPIISRADELSSEAVKVLEALLKMTQPSPIVTDLVRALPNREISALLDKVLGKARQETTWGIPPILNAATAIANVSPSHAAGLIAFMSTIPSAQIKPNIVARLSGTSWGAAVLDAWDDRPDLSKPVRTAIGKVEA